MAVKKIKIIIADDDDDDIMFFEDCIHELDSTYEITRAGNGDQLMKLLNDESLPLPMFIFLDINMPLKNGFDCLKEIKESSRLKNIPVIILSTSARPEVIDKMYFNKASRYIIKPNSFDILKICISNALKVNSENNLYSARERFEISFHKK